MLRTLTAATATADLTVRTGVVQQLSGLVIEARGPDAVLGEVCSIAVRGQAEPLQAEVVGMRAGQVTLMPYGSSQGLAPGCEVTASGELASIGVGPALLGRVIDGFGRALDGRPDPATTERRLVKGKPLNPMHRPRIEKVMETGVRTIDALLTLGQGQRVGIFAGSGVGKSTLLGMVARHVRADVNVIALIGERGREVREFIDKQLGEEGLARSVVVVATSDQPALARLRAAYAAVTIAEAFRDEGKQVMLTMDSIARFAMARREVGLSAGEPPTARGYTPSVFAELPELCERCGTSGQGGAITALLTVLVEGDDLNEPVTDCLRATLDGHIVLSRQLANQGQYPAIDALKSVSRLMPDLATGEEQALAVKAVEYLALLDRNRQLVDIGAYVRGTNAALDRAIDLEPQLLAFLKQSSGGVARHLAVQQLAGLLKGAA
ncbi:FliI/YscN family ATPase [Rhizobacter sp. Root1221]|uniref:FliI/YscN family ATPase n=1 Tax=Rhizobacter sp. Root1221 TaxID=1736433 RepID=UPI0006F3A3CB|nr:FliI/YscN family ATPase [Rhizobacter sp. Root1221]KQV92871.1 flagellar protein export ATPase FliI [Rhizobacter sp. Root1221]